MGTPQTGASQPLLMTVTGPDGRFTLQGPLPAAATLVVRAGGGRTGMSRVTEAGMLQHLLSPWAQDVLDERLRQVRVP